MGLSESIAVTEGDQYQGVDQVRLYAIPYTMEWLVCQKLFLEQLSYGLQVLFFSACNLQSSGAECDQMKKSGCWWLFGAGMEWGEVWKRRDGLQPCLNYCFYGSNIINLFLTTHPIKIVLPQILWVNYQLSWFDVACMCFSFVENDLNLTRYSRKTVCLLCINPWCNI